MLNCFIAIGLLLPGLAAQDPPPPRPAADTIQDSPLYRTSVNLVVLHATVRDAAGQIVTGLSAGNFEIREDGVTQEIRFSRAEDVPVTVGLVIDHSGSMSAKLADVIAAARAFVLASNPRDQMFVVNFNERVRFGLTPPTLFSNRPDDLEAAIRRDSAVGETALYDAMYLALERMPTGGHEKNVLIVISDGADNASRRVLNEVLQAAGQTGTLIYTIGVFGEEEVERNSGVLKRIARATGGEAFFPRRSTQAIDIAERISREVRRQYTLGYLPANQASSNAYRRVRVTARTPGSKGLSVRTRTGYFPRPDSLPGARP